LTPSKFVKQKLQKNFSVPANKVVVTYEGADPAFLESSGPTQGQERQIKAKYGIKKPFIVYVGNAFPYKNLGLILEMLTQVKDLEFVYAGSRNFFVERLVERAKELQLEDRFKAAGFVPKEDLKVLYKLAESYVFPSLSEGFGLPGLDALASGCPLLASDIPVFREVYGEAAVYFNPKSASQLGDRLRKIRKDKKFRQAQIKTGLEQVKKYSWKRMAQETLNIYQGT
jgi:glycosyltransferase involved in cell wall biosynthesis